MRGQRWGTEGPPEEAYSRVSRDLPVVFAPVARRLEALPPQLEERYRVNARTPTLSEATRLTAAQPHWPISRAVALHPSAPGASVLIVGRWDADDGGFGIVVALGEQLAYVFPSCWCDACDTDAEEVLDDLDYYLDAVTGGFIEYRDHGMLGFRYAGGGKAHGGSEGPDLAREWAAWGRHNGSPDPASGG